MICTCFIITRRQTGCHDTLWRKPLRLEKLLIAFPFSISALPCVVKSLVPALYPVDQAHGFIASYRVFLSRYMSRPLSHYLAPSRRLPPFHRRKRKWLRVSDHCYEMKRMMILAQLCSNNQPFETHDRIRKIGPAIRPNKHFRGNHGILDGIFTSLVKSSRTAA